MSFNIQITTDSSSANAVFALLIARVSTPGISAFMAAIVDPFIRNRIDQRFSMEGDDVTGHWHPLTAATEHFRSTKGFPPDHPINVRTSTMRNFLTGTPGDIRPTGPWVTYTHPPPGGTYGLTDLKIETAQRGKARPLTPPRPVIGVNQNDLLFITSELAAYLIA